MGYCEDEAWECHVKEDCLGMEKCKDKQCTCTGRWAHPTLQSIWSLSSRQHLRVWLWAWWRLCWTFLQHPTGISVQVKQEIVDKSISLHLKVRGKSLQVWGKAHGMWGHWGLCRGWSVRRLHSLLLHQQLLRPALVGDRRGQAVQILQKWSGLGKFN